jgi:DNA primase
MLKKTGFISQEQKEHILKQTDIVQLIGEYVQLKASGRNFTGLCPFHQEKTPSFTVSPSYQNFKCYGCGESGDSIRFIMGIENLQFIEAMELLAERSGIQLESSKSKPFHKSFNTDVEKCLELSFGYFRDNLVKAGEQSIIKSYLLQRRISDDLAASFQLGFVEAGWQNLNRFLNSRSINDELQEKAGLIKKGDKGGHYDRLRNRLIFPIRDKRNRLLGFAGRVIGDDEPKYLNPPETELYKKSSVFYGIDKAHDHIRRNRRAIVVEGYLDVIRLHEQEWFESIATCGTAVTSDHVSELKKSGADEVVLLFDGDNAGIKAAEKSARFFLENDLDSKVVILPDGLDPDDYFKTHSNREFKTLLENALFDFEFIISKTREQLPEKGIQQREILIREIVGLSSNMRTGTKRDLFLAKAAEEFKVGKRKLERIFSQSDRPGKPQPSNPENQSTPYFSKEHIPEVKFLQYLMNHVEGIATARKNILANEFINKDLAEIYARFLQLSDDEFRLLNAKDFPEQFVEHRSLLMYLLHHEIEYKGPLQVRTGSEEMLKLKAENEEQTQSFSEQALNLRISRLKKNRKVHDLKKLRYFSPDQEKKMVKRFIEERSSCIGQNKSENP